MTAGFSSVHGDGDVTVYGGDCLAILRAGATLGYDWTLGYEPDRLVPDNSIDAVVTDPPYGLEFMGQAWDAPWRSHKGVVDADDWNQGDSNPYSRSRSRSGRRRQLWDRQRCRDWPCVSGVVRAVGG